MRLPAATLLVATALAAPAFFAGPLPQGNRVSVRVIDTNAEGYAIVQLTPSPLAVMEFDKDVVAGEALTCTLETDYLDCGNLAAKPLGFVVRGESPDLRVDQNVKRSH